MPNKSHSYVAKVCWCGWSVLKAKKQNRLRQWETWWRHFSNGNLEEARKTIYRQKHGKISSAGGNWPVKWKNQKELKSVFGSW